jgi:hypothetical protein
VKLGSRIAAAAGLLLLLASAASAQNTRERAGTHATVAEVSAALAAQPSLGGARNAGQSQAEAYGRAVAERGPMPEAIAWLKEASETHPRSKALRWLLARAYLKDGNRFWALRTLGRITVDYPEDCEPWLWIAWIELQQGVLEEAREALSAARCGPEMAATTRKKLLLSMVEQNAKNEKAAKETLQAARKARAIFREDTALLERLITALDPGYNPPFSLKAELSAGWTSNARAGSPADAITREQTSSSPLGQISLWTRLLAPTGRWMRPSVELEARALGYSADTGRDLSYVQLDGRPGVLVGDDRPTALLAYRYQSLLLAGGDRYDAGPIWFYDAHRGEVELEILSSLSFFGGGGRRRFRESGRSRNELDGGLGGSIKLGPAWRLMGAFTGRGHHADKAPYHLVGGSLLLSAETRLPAGWSARAGVLPSLDAYPRSTGYFDPTATKTARKDVLIKLSASGYSPVVTNGIKLGITYEYAQRLSTADPYDYRDHRILLKLLGTLSADPWLPVPVSLPGHVPIDYGLETGELEERVQDLLRRDESVQRSSSCIE